MDYSSFFEDYLLGEVRGNCNNISVKKLTESIYQADIYYSDEEIENYLDRGFNLILKITITEIDELDNSIGFELDLIDFVAPGVSETNSDYLHMATSLYSEVARTAYECIYHINFGSNWLSLD
jgi:hypothetical protein